MGPTARSQVRSPSHSPASVSRMLAKPSPSRTGPSTGGTARWRASNPRPARDPDSTCPMAASNRASRWHDCGMAAAATTYAAHNAWGTLKAPGTAGPTGPTGPMGPTVPGTGATAAGSDTAYACRTRSARSRRPTSSYHCRASGPSPAVTWVVDSASLSPATATPWSAGALMPPRRAMTASTRPNSSRSSRRGEGRLMTRGAWSPRSCSSSFGWLTRDTPTMVCARWTRTSSSMPPLARPGHLRME